MVRRVAERTAGDWWSFRWWFENRETGQITIAQFPNWPLFAIGAGYLVRAIADDGSTFDDVAGAAIVGLWLFWGADELIRGVFMLLFFVAARLVSVLVVFIALFQFLCALIVRKPNNNARRFGKDLSCYLAEIILFLSYNTERKPWPFSR